MKPFHMCGQSTVTTVVHGEVNIFMMLLNMSVIHRRSVFSAL